MSSPAAYCGGGRPDCPRAPGQPLPPSSGPATTTLHRLAPAVAGVAGIVGSAVAADVWAARTARPTISAAVAEALEHPIAGPVALGVLTAVGWHLVADPIIRRITT